MTSIVDTYSWADFIKAFTAMNTDPYFEDNYPDFNNFNEQNDFNIQLYSNYYIPFAIKAIRRGENVQVCLDSYIDVLGKYSIHKTLTKQNEFIIINIFIMAGAVFPIGKVFI